jgi:hypothetical protein
MNNHEFKRYLRWLAGTIIAVVSACGILNLFMDPLGIFGSPRVRGLNEVKPYLDHHRELARWKGALRLCGEAGIFGNSRAEIGFNPEHNAFDSVGHRAFNHAIPGSTLSMAVQQLEWLKHSNCTPKSVIIGVDFISFIGSPSVRNSHTKASSPPKIGLQDLVETVFSISAVNDSLKTLYSQYVDYPATITSRGFNPLLNYSREASVSGYSNLFLQSAESIIYKWSRKSTSSRKVSLNSEEFFWLERFLAATNESSELTHIVLYPYHIQLRHIMDHFELEGEFHSWKSMLLSVTEKYPNVKVWDFSGLRHETTEPIPPPGDIRTEVAFYWEAAHFKSKLGDLIISQIIGGQNGFGSPLTRHSIPVTRAHDSARLQEESSTNAALKKELKALYERVQ